MSESRFAHYIAKALGIEIVPLAIGALIRTTRHLSWSALDGVGLAATVVAATLGLTLTLFLANRPARRATAPFVRNILVSLFMVMGLLSVVNTYRLLAKAGAVVDYGRTALMILVGGIIVGIGMTAMQRMQKKDSAFT